MATIDALEDAHPLVGEVREAYLANGGSNDEWIDILTRPTLPRWAREWFKAGEPETLKQFDMLVSNYLDKYELIEYAVRDDTGALTGYAVASVVETKTSRTHLSLKVKHLQSNDLDFDNWASFHLGADPDFHLHICKKKAGSCTAKPPQKDLGWFHVSAFRMLTYADAFLEGYSPDAIITDLKEYVEVCLAELEESRRDKAPKPPPREDQEKKASPGVGRRGGAELKQPVGAVEPEARGGLKAALKAASSKAGYQGSKDKKEPLRDEQSDAKALAAQASAALGAGHPQLFPRDAPGRAEVDMGTPGLDWLDKISAPGDEDRFPEPPKGRGGDSGRTKVALEPNRGRQNRGGPGGGRDNDGSEGDPGEESGKRRKKESRSPSGRRGRERNRQKDRRRRRQGGDPGDGPSSSSGKGQPKKSKRGEWLSPPPKEERRRKRKKRKKKSSGRGSSGDSGSSKSEDGFYGRGSSKFESLAEKARRHPGRLLRSGLEQMAKYVAARSGDGHEAGIASWREQRVGAYLNQVLFTQHSPEKIGIRNVRELVTLSEAIDLLMENNLPAVGDVLMQRMKALESSLTEGWQMAAYQELIPPSRASLTTDMERSFAAKQALQMKKLQESVRPRKG